MDLRKMMVVCAVALSGLAVGCGNKCKSSCEDGQKCADATAEEKALDCGKFCDDADSVSDAASCSDQFDKLVDCQDDADACSATSCSAQTDAWSTCVGTYCVAHATDAKCTAFFKDIGASS
jgi:hypothetical protein